MESLFEHSTLTCRRCGRAKPPHDFPRNRRSKTGRHIYCKPCHIEAIRESRAKHHGNVQNFLLKHRYDIDVPTFNWLSLQQNQVCAICKTDPPEHVDHDHVTGRLRGLVCFNCNGGLGKAGDDRALLVWAMHYLSRP